MRKIERRLTTKLTLNTETVRTLMRGELTKVVGRGDLADSHDPCTVAMPQVAPTKAAPCG
jgi:hypothetical protein